jgi:hypothetical protein
MRNTAAANPPPATIASYPLLTCHLEGKQNVWPARRGEPATGGRGRPEADILVINVGLEPLGVSAKGWQIVIFQSPSRKSQGLHREDANNLFGPTSRLPPREVDPGSDQGSARPQVTPG